MGDDEMIGRRGFLQRLLSWPLLGCVAGKALGEQVITHPPAPDMIVLYSVPRQEGDHPAYSGKDIVVWLSGAGRAAWDRGEDLDPDKGHFMGMNGLARREVVLAKFLRITSTGKIIAVIPPQRLPNPKWTLPAVEPRNRRNHVSYLVVP